MSPEMQKQRWRLVRSLTNALETPLTLLAIIWLVLLIVDLTGGLSPALALISNIIWAIFFADFALRLVIAPDRLIFLKHNWATAVALLLPAVRILRFARIVRAARGVRFVRVLTSMNRGMRALSKSMRRRGLSYVLALTTIVLFAGAAGMYAFEQDTAGNAITGYGEALWWTAMLLTTIGSEYWPRTSEGRALTLVLSLYGVGILGYVAATLATFFIGRDAEDDAGEIASAATLRDIQHELQSLREELRLLRP